MTTTEPTQEQIGELFGLMDALNAVNPWGICDAGNLFEIKGPGCAESVYVTPFMNTQKVRVLHVYSGLAELSSFFRLQTLLDEGGKTSVFRVSGLQQSIGCVLSDRRLIAAEDSALFTALHYETKEKYAWPSFKRFRAELNSRGISADDAKVLLDTLPQYIEACKMVRQGIVSPEFDNGDIVFRQFKNNVWQTRVRRNPHLDIPILSFRFNDGKSETMDMLQKLKKTAPSPYTMETDIIRFNDFSEKNKNGDGVCKRLVLTANQTDGKLQNSIFVKPDNNANEELLDLLVYCMSKYGKPERLAVHDGYIGSIVRDLCKRIDITLTETGVPTIDKNLLGEDKK
jgi:hypothetical protein